MVAPWLGLAVEGWHSRTQVTAAALNGSVNAVPDIGLLLPCNVVVRQARSDQVRVGFLDPQLMARLVGKSEVQLVADVAEQSLRRVCKSPGGTSLPT
jgi:hypothetical protein